MSSTMEQYFIYNIQYSLLICREHGYAVSSSSLPRHLRNHHPRLELERRTEILERIQSLSLLEPGEIRIPQDTPTAINGLKVINSLQCTACGFIRMNVKNMSNHCYSTHGWTKELGCGWMDVKVQTFFEGPHRR